MSALPKIDHMSRRIRGSTSARPIRSPRQKMNPPNDNGQAKPDGNNLKSQLETYYRNQGIHSLDFRCRHQASCRSGCKAFTEAKASLVGNRYGDPIRVVVLSLDPGNGWPNPDARTLEAVAARHSKDKPDTFAKNKHWYRTYETVAAVLSVVVGRQFLPREIVGRFAHVNAAKCSHNLPNKKQAPKRLFDNCRSYLENELVILAPDILITQGKRAAMVARPWEMRSHRKSVLQICERSSYWLELTHPTAWGGAYGEDQKSWPHRFAQARKWMETQPERSARANDLVDDFPPNHG